MEFMLSAIVPFLFFIAGIFILYKTIRTRKIHNVKKNAQVLEVTGIAFEEKGTYRIYVEYEHLLEKHQVYINTHIFKKPEVNQIIVIRINPDKPNEAVYYGKNDNFYFVEICTSWVIILSMLGYCVYYLFWQKA